MVSPISQSLLPGFLSYNLPPTGRFEMTNPAFNPEDPRLTAFVLGEIGDSDRAEIEQLLETSPAAQAAVKEIEETIGVLKEGLASEPAPELTAEQRAAVEEQLAGSTVVAAAGTASKRPGARLGKFAGAVASVAVLGIVVTFATPQLQPARDALMAPLEQLSAKYSNPTETVAMMDSEETTGFNDEEDDGDCKGIRLTRSATKPADGYSEPEYPGVENLVADAGRVLVELAPESRPARPGASNARATSGFDATAEVRSEGDFAKRDGSQPASASPGKISADYDRASKSKDRNDAQSAQRLIADTGSRPRVNNSRQGQLSRGTAAPRSGKPTAAPMAEEESKSKNESFVTKLDVQVTDSTQGGAGLPRGFRPPPAPTSREPAADKTSQSSQVASTASGKSVNGPRVEAPRASGPRVGNSQSGKPHTRETVVRNGVLVTSGDLANSLLIDKRKGRLKGGLVEVTDSLVPANAVALLPGKGKTKLPSLGGDATDSKESARSIALVPGQNQSKKRVLFLEKINPATGLKRKVAQIDIDNERMSEARLQAFGFGNETYEAIVENDFIVPVLGDKEKSLSTISVDVDTASYANMRRFLSRDQLPPANSVRIEELVNYFKYDYPEPEGDEPFSVKTELASCPWQPSHRLAMVGLKAKTIDKAQRPPTNLVFLLDVSGSMRASNKLPLVQQSMRLLVEEMTEDDRVSIVTYASNAGVRLGSTLGSKKQEILNAINGLRAGGSTNGEGGIRMAYDEANRHYFQGGANRVILCSDGDFNVGKSSDGELVELIQEKAASGVFLSVFGFGMGNLKDGKLEKLADKGNGHYGYIDNLNEARKVFRDELVGTLYTVAKDVKLQVEFNPATVGAYRLIGYENRKLAAQDFTDDTKDAGEIGSGHTVTALYEIIPKHVLMEQPSVDGLKYQAAAKKPVDEGAKETLDGDSALDSADPAETQPVDQELLNVQLRYKKPDEEISQPMQEYPVLDVSIAGKQLSAISDDLMFAASVASFGMNLRRSKYRGNWGFAEVLETAQGAQSDFDQAQRTEFVQLVQRAMRITGQQVGPQPRTNEGSTTRPGELDSSAARIKAAIGGKYRRLVKRIEVRDDFQRFGAFNDYGHWDGSEYAGHKYIPPGNWVYVYPNWYIWAEAVVPPVETKPAAKPTVEKAAETKPAVK
jgi:Ca-activated chloride channel family protein